MNVRLFHSGVLLLALHSLSLLSGFGGEDPARFMAVNGWRGTFGKDMSITGSGAYGTGITDYSFVHHLNVTTTLCPVFVIPLMDTGKATASPRRIPRLR